MKRLPKDTLYVVAKGLARDTTEGDLVAWFRELGFDFGVDNVEIGRRGDTALIAIPRVDIIACLQGVIGAGPVILSLPNSR